MTFWSFRQIYSSISYRYTVYLSISLIYPKWYQLPLKIKVKVVKVGNSLRMTIPKDIVREMGLKAGDQLLVSLTDSQMLVEKQTPITMDE